jgi:hypothetical protein
MPWVAFGELPHIEHTELGAVSHGNVDSSRNGDPLSPIKLLDELGDGLSVWILYKDRMMSGDPDRTPIARPHLKATLPVGWATRAVAGAARSMPPSLKDGTV